MNGWRPTLTQFTFIVAVFYTIWIRRKGGQHDAVHGHTKQTCIQWRYNPMFCDKTAVGYVWYAGEYHTELLCNQPKGKCTDCRHETRMFSWLPLQIFKIWSQLFNGKGPSLISPNSAIKSTQIVECAVGDGTVIAEKTSLKNSVLGRNCQVIEKVRISDSVLMNGVVIEERWVENNDTDWPDTITISISRVVLESCVVCDNVVIKSGSILKSCLIGPNYIVPVDTKSERVHLTNADGFMEIEW